MLGLLQKLANAIAAILVAIALGLVYQHYGFQAGFDIGKMLYASPEIEITFSSHGSGTYEFFAGKYALVATATAIFLTIRFVEESFRRSSKPLGVLGQLVCFLCLAFALYQLLTILSEKRLREQSLFWLEPYDYVLRSAVLRDQICLGLIVILLITQVVFVVLSYKNRRSLVGADDQLH